MGKLTKVQNYPVHHRGGAGVKTLNITTRTGPVAAARVVEPQQELMIITKEGIMLRTTLQQVRVTGRAAQGVRVMNVDGKDTVASISCFDQREDAPKPNENGAKTRGRNGGTPNAAPEESAAEPAASEEPLVDDAEHIDAFLAALDEQEIEDDGE